EKILAFEVSIEFFAVAAHRIGVDRRIERSSVRLTVQRYLAAYLAEGHVLQRKAHVTHFANRLRVHGIEHIGLFPSERRQRTGHSQRGKEIRSDHVGSLCRRSQRDPDATKPPGASA